MSDRTTDGPAAGTGGSPAAGPTTNPAGSLARRVVVTVSFLVCVVGSMVGVGVFGGTPISEAAGGLLATDTTHLAPASPAFSVWTLIYIALGAYTIWQWWDRSDSRRIGWLIAASLLLNAAWILTVQAGWVWGSVAVIVVLLAVLAAAFRQLLTARPRSLIEAAVADGTVGLYLGWVSVATCANIAAALAGSGVTGGGYPEVWAVVVLVVVAGIGVALAVVGRGRLAPAATLVWGLAWIAVARTDEPVSLVTTIAAGTAAVIVAVATVTMRLRTRPGAHDSVGTRDPQQRTGPARVGGSGPGCPARVAGSGPGCPARVAGSGPGGLGCPRRPGKVLHPRGPTCQYRRAPGPVGGAHRRSRRRQGTATGAVPQRLPSPGGH